MCAERAVLQYRTVGKRRSLIVPVRTSEIHEIERGAEMVAGSSLIVELAEEDILIRQPWPGSYVASDEVDGGRALCSSKSCDHNCAATNSAIAIACDHAIYGVGRASAQRARIDNGERTPLSVIVAKKEQLIFDHWPAEAAAKLLPLVFGLGGCLAPSEGAPFAEWIKGIQGGVAQVVEDVSMHVVRAGF